MGVLLVSVSRFAELALIDVYKSFRIIGTNLLHKAQNMSP